MDVSAANNHFAADALRELSRSAEGQNVVFSSLSVFTALAVVYLGAKGNTAAQIGKTLHFDEVKTLHSGCQNLLNELEKNTDSYVFTIANRLFGQKSFEYIPDFLEDAKKLYSADLEKLDFNKDTEKSRLYINNWISQETKGKIQQLLPEQSITPNTALVVTNALYFAANWTKPFSNYKTHKAPFTLLSNEKVTVDMMFVVNSFKVTYIEDPGVKVLELPYGPVQDFSMVIILPDSNLIFKQVTREMSLEKLNAWINFADVKLSMVHVEMPKFKAEQSFSLKKMLRSMGITEMFSEVKANFSGMSKQGHLYMSDMYHKTTIEVNEKGTEAASSSASVMSLRIAASEEFKAHHPFFFAIKHNKSNCILLCGKVDKP
ncbi:leukocyte elastase inhibitor-like [Hyperolius riggenbachi]|uniref:leukocyte elastase inhibitor-like n=1 Tax=Hyperolius riggenbachi TaxID=752182 RepID=UPI0035A2BAE4